jgi:hypothetical protein
LQSSRGTNDVCKHCLTNAHAETHFSSAVKSIRHEKNTKHWRLQSFGGSDVLADAVIFTGTVAEVLTTHGDMGGLVRPFMPKLRQVKYSKQFCLAVVFDASVAKLCEEFFAHSDVLEAPSNGRACVDRIMWQNSKIKGNTLPVIVATTTTGFGEASSNGLRATHRKDASNERRLKSIGDEIVAHVCMLMARSSYAIANQLKAAVVDRKLNYWKFSRVLRPAGPSCLPISTAPPFVLAGDYLADRSNFGGCARSAQAAANFIGEHILRTSGSRPQHTDARPRQIMQQASAPSAPLHVATTISTQRDAPKASGPALKVLVVGAGE